MKDAPIRTCCGCRARRPQRELIRVVRRAGGEVVVGSSSTPRGEGRGAYVCFARSCAERALRSGALRKALRHPGPLPERLGEELVRIAEREEREG